MISLKLKTKLAGDRNKDALILPLPYDSVEMTTSRQSNQ